jgi:hypothetical protein
MRPRCMTSVTASSTTRSGCGGQSCPSEAQRRARGDRAHQMAFQPDACQGRQLPYAAEISGDSLADLDARALRPSR